MEAVKPNANTPWADVDKTMEESAKPRGPAPTGSTKLGKDEFMKMLLTQLKNQDPTQPLDSHAFIAQLAQFSTLEMSFNTNKTLESIMLGQAAQQQLQAVNLVGKDVLFRTDGFNLGAGEPATFLAQLEGPADNVVAVITDDSGRVVRTLQLGPRPAGSTEISWDGLDDLGNPQPPGSYTARVTASDKAGASVGVEQQGHGKVTGVSYANGVPEIMLGSLRVKLSNVVEIKERSAP